MKLTNADVVMLIGRLLTSCPLDVHNFFLNGILLYKNDTFSFCTSLNIRLWVRKAALLDWNVMFWNEFVDVDNCTLWVWICNWRADLVWSLFFVVGIILFFFLCQNSNSVSGIPGQLEDPAQSSPQENIFAPLVLMVRISRNRSSPVPSVCFFFFFLNSSSRTLSSFRFVASFAYYGSVLSSSELLEKNLLCVIDPDEEHSVKHRHEDSLCYCIPFAQSDYQTLMISCLGEFGCKLMCHLTSRAPPPGQRSHLLNRVCLNLRMTTCPAPPPPMSLQWSL